MKKPIKRILLGALFLVLIVAAYVGFDIWHLAKGIPEAYAAWDCASLIEEYMETHDGTWPKSWDDLFSAAEKMPLEGDRMLRGHSKHDMRKIADLVRVDWKADPKILSQTKCADESIPFHVITRLDGSAFPTVWSGREPNTLIWIYLKEKSSNNTSNGIHQPVDGSPKESI